MTRNRHEIKSDEIFLPPLPDDDDAKSVLGSPEQVPRDTPES